ncbi:beta-N-acetylhexosaminidase [Sphingomonas glaciei]|uniref:beta-N-acetylhexosaminidase n=1 Tax=Sphingomonas glaciei TaxID=2938948 RepID=A0ABY5MXD8_9SPHN|nr:beta-N-acetylhexosaminidase [Sphingomonas glaciei]UUR07788.1 beta-N-acetylhexosaminidase [Sphingomonas glaciei]
MQAAIYGLAGLTLSPDERAFFRDVDPAGYILFARNCGDPDQLMALTASLRDLHGRADLPILIDQEGGRVMRMKPPVWPSLPAGGAFEKLYQTAPSSAIEAARMNARAIGLMLSAHGINVNCIPNLDVRQPDADKVVGDRAYGTEPMQVAAIGRAVLDGLGSAGVVGVVKHMPGHGRATVDSHKELPRVSAAADELEVDLEPFETLREASMGMVAHILFEAWDSELPSSQSPFIIEEIIRKRIGFSGLLMTDDIGMEALKGSAGERSAAALAAGCDLTLHCSGDFAEMLDVAAHVGAMDGEAEGRLARAMAGAMLGSSEGPDFAAAVAVRDELLALA